jgi:hypothetical protein
VEWWTWVFSGIGVTLFAGLAKLFYRRDRGQVSLGKMKQRAGKNSTNIQAGRDIDF